MKVCRLNLLFLLLAMPILTLGIAGCPDEVTDDNGGGKKDTEEEEEEEEEEEITLVAVGGVCQTSPTVDFGPGNCQEGLVCIPGLNDGWGTCRLSCATLNADNQVEEDASVCTGAETCQTILPNTRDKLTGNITEGMFAMVCMPQTTDQTSQCYGIYDEDSCSDSRDCQIAGFDYIRGADGSVTDYLFTDLRCRTICDPAGLDETLAECTGDDICLWNQDPVAGYDVVWQGDDPDTEDLAGEWIECVEASCDDDSDATACTCTTDENNGQPFECLGTTDGKAHCGYFNHAGWCGVPVDLITVAQWDAAQGVGLPNDVICDEVDDTRLCDDRPFREIGVGADLSCVGISSTSNEGICMAFCKVPADPADLDDDGFDGSCPTGLECSPDLGAALIFGPWVDENGFADDRESAKTCDPVECPEGLPCEACGSTEYQCGTVQTDSQGNTASACFAPYSFCQAPVVDVPEDTDGGVMVEDVDAGMADETLDAGTTDVTDATDAGTTDVTDATDAGTTDETDAGSGGTTTTCDAGYYLDSDTCIAHTTCDANATATAGTTTTDATCECNTGYFGDGVTCAAHTVCDATNATTTAGTTTTDATCECNTGYFGDGVTCTAHTVCDATNATTTAGTTTTDATCECNTGYFGDGATCAAHTVTDCSAGETLTAGTTTADGSCAACAADTWDADSDATTACIAHATPDCSTVASSTLAAGTATADAYCGCDADHFADGAGACTPCASGTNTAGDDAAGTATTCE
jgi:hypothetical protein